VDPSTVESGSKGDTKNAGPGGGGGGGSGGGVVSGGGEVSSESDGVNLPAAAAVAVASAASDHDAIRSSVSFGNVSVHGDSFIHVLKCE